MVETTATNEKQQTGYPSIDKPWLKYYSENSINAPLPEKTMYEYIWEKNKDYPEDNAFHYYGTRISYGKLFEMIQKSISFFYDIGIRKGDIVTIMSMHTPEVLYALYGLNYIGAVANMVYLTLSDREILHTLRDTESKALMVLDVAIERVARIHDQIEIPVFILGVADSMPMVKKAAYFVKEQAGRMKTHRKTIIPTYLSFSKMVLSVDDSCLKDVTMSHDHEAAAVIVYTSGTTGEPKGVVLSSDCLNAVAYQLSATDRDYKRGDKALLAIPSFLGYGISMLHLCVSEGMLGDLFITLNNAAVGIEFDKFRPNRLVTGPPCLDDIMKYSKGNLHHVIEVTGGGSLINAEKEREFNSFLHKHGSRTQYLSGYGMTECASVLFLNMRHAYKKDSLGVPLPSVSVKIEDTDTHEELQFDCLGEICVSSPSLMIGYFRNNEATKEAVETDERGMRWLHTGDLGYVDKDGFVFITGRIKRVFYTRGSDGVIYRIFCQRIEDICMSHQNAKLCGVVVREDEERLNIPIVYTVLKEPERKQATILEIKQIAGAELPEHMRPAEICVVDYIPLTASGKVDYRRLTEKYE